MRHEVKNGLLTGIELVDNLRNALDEIHHQVRGHSSEDENSGNFTTEKDNLSACWKRLSELDNNLHEVLDTVLAEAMARDVINEVYQPRFESIDVVAQLKSDGLAPDRFPVKAKQAHMPYLKMDQQLLRYIHRNAVSNACKYGRQGELVLTLVSFNCETMEFELQVINSPGEGHEKLRELGNASEAVFEQGLRLHDNHRIKNRFVSAGDGAWIAQKCAKAMGGSCHIQFQKDLTLFSFKCPTEALFPKERVDTKSFEVPPNTIGVAVDDSKIQRKLLARIMGLVGVSDENMRVIGEQPADVFDIENVITDLLDQNRDSRILIIIDENLDYGGRGEEVVILSGSKIMKDILTALPPEDERRVFALIRSANDSAGDLATYLSRAHGFFPKAPMTRDRVREILAPLWAERFVHCESQPPASA